MLRFDYQEQPNGQFNVTVVSERGNSHSLAGRLVLEAEEWKRLVLACEIFNEDNMDGPNLGSVEFFKFEKKENVKKGE